MNNLLIHPLLERKQVGVLYHFTHNWNSLTAIVQSNQIRSLHHMYVSFTRDHDLRYWGRYIRVAVDGNRLSDRYSFEPFAYKSEEYDETTRKKKVIYLSNEREERIMKPVVDVSGCILSIDVLDPSTRLKTYNFDQEDYDWGVEQFNKELNRFTESCPDTAVNVVPRFKPVR